MSYFGKFYLDKDKDIVVELDMNDDKLSFMMYVNNHRRDNVINNLANISHMKTSVINDKTFIALF